LDQEESLPEVFGVEYMLSLMEVDIDYDDANLRMAERQE
jgi:hypothetical protein